MQRFEKEKILILIKTENWSSTTTSIVTLFWREVSGPETDRWRGWRLRRGTAGAPRVRGPVYDREQARKTDSAGNEES